MLLVVLTVCLGLSAASICTEDMMVPKYGDEEGAEEGAEVEMIPVAEGRMDLRERVEEWLTTDGRDQVAVFQAASLTLDIILEVPACQAILDESYCYYHVGKERYADIEEPEDLTFSLMKDGVENAKFMANHLCKNLQNCWTQANAEFVSAYYLDEDFKAVMNASMVDPLQQMEDTLDQLEDDFEEFADTIKKIREFIEEQSAKEISGENWDALKMYNDISDGLTKFNTWCNLDDNKESPCVQETADMVEDLMDDLHGKEENEGVCRPTTFCEECQATADAFMSDEEKGVPCCLKKVIDKGIEKYKDWQEEEEGSYDEAYNIFKDALETFLDKDDKEMLETQAECYKESYNKDTKKCIKKEEVDEAEEDEEEDGEEDGEDVEEA